MIPLTRGSDPYFRSSCLVGYLGLILPSHHQRLDLFGTTVPCCVYLGISGKHGCTWL
jgi:hypothetical protein